MRTTLALNGLNVGHRHRMESVDGVSSIQNFKNFNFKKFALNTGSL